MYAHEEGERGLERNNHFLEALTRADAALLEPSLRKKTLARDDLVVAENALIANVVLPLDCILSVVMVMEGGRQVEARTIGVESGFGLLHALGSFYSFERTTVQIGGEAVILPLPALRTAARTSPSLTDAIVRFAQASLVQAGQTAACNALHSAEQRLCRWLMMTRDRVGKDLLSLTQEHLSIMVGVQRTTVTAIATQLQAERLVSYSRGKIRILDSAAIAARSCECRNAINDAAAQVMTI